MTAKENLNQAVLDAFRRDTDKEDPERVASAITNILCAFAEVVRGPAPEAIRPSAAEQTPFVAELRTANEKMAELSVQLRETIHIMRLSRG